MLLTEDDRSGDFGCARSRRFSVNRGMGSTPLRGMALVWGFQYPCAWMQFLPRTSTQRFVVTADSTQSYLFTSVFTQHATGTQSFTVLIHFSGTQLSYSYYLAHCNVRQRMSVRFFDPGMHQYPIWSTLSRRPGCNGPFSWRIRVCCNCSPWLHFTSSSFLLSRQRFPSLSSMPSFPRHPFCKDSCVRDLPGLLPIERNGLQPR